MFSSKELKKANEQFLRYVDQKSNTTADKIVNKGEAFDATKTVQEFTDNIESCWLSQYIGKTVNINQKATEQDGYYVLRCKALDLKPLVSTIGKHTVTGSFSKLVGNALNSPALNNVDLFKKETDFKVRDLLMEAVMYSQSAGRKVTAKVEGRITKQ